jgi:hypothetical protein
MLSLVWLLLFTVSWAYRVMEYDMERCTHNAFRTHHLADPSACTKLNVRVASSILVKINNIHDDQYQLNVYDNNDCTGDVVGTLRNLNGCMDLFSPDDNRVGRSVKLTQASASVATDPERDWASKRFEADQMFNVDTLEENKFMAPIARGVFQYVERSDRSDDGTYRGKVIELFFPQSLKRLLAQEARDAWDDYDADQFEQLASETRYERLLNQAGFYYNRVYAEVADWGERLVRVVY